VLDKLRKDWEKLDRAKELLEDGPIDYLDEPEAKELYKLLKKMEHGIKDILSVKESGILKGGN